MSNKHQLIRNTYCILTPEDCKKWFEWAKENGIETAWQYIENDNCLRTAIVKGELVFVTSKYNVCREFIEFSEISADEFISRLQGKWQPNEVSDYQSFYEAEKAKNEKLTQGVKDAKAEMDKYSVAYQKSGEESWAGGKYQGIMESIEILTEKTGI